MKRFLFFKIALVLWFAISAYTFMSVDTGAPESISKAWVSLKKRPIFPPKWVDLARLYNEKEESENFYEAIRMATLSAANRNIYLNSIYKEFRHDLPKDNLAPIAKRYLALNGGELYSEGVQYYRQFGPQVFYQQFLPGDEPNSIWSKSEYFRRLIEQSSAKDLRFTSAMWNVARNEDKRALINSPRMPLVINQLLRTNGGYQTLSALLKEQRSNGYYAGESVKPIPLIPANLTNPLCWTISFNSSTEKIDFSNDHITVSANQIPTSNKAPHNMTCFIGVSLVQPTTINISWYWEHKLTGLRSNENNYKSSISVAELYKDIHGTQRKRNNTVNKSGTWSTQRDSISLALTEESMGLFITVKLPRPAQQLQQSNVKLGNIKIVKMSP